MTLYKRQVRPMIYSPGCQGFSDTYIPVNDEEDWHDEEWSNGMSTEKILTAYYTPKLKKQDPWASLRFDERYVPINGEGKK